MPSVTEPALPPPKRAPPLLPDFPIAVTLEDETFALVARDVPTGVFFFRFPDDLPGSECWKKAEPQERRRVELGNEAWLDQVLMGAIVKPRLSPELIRRLGAERERAVESYFRTVGWIPPDPDAVDPSADLTILPAGEMEPSTVGIALRPLTSMPGKNVSLGVRQVAAKARVAPHVVWTQWSISEFVLNWRFLMADLKDRKAQRDDEDPVMAQLMAIGPEAIDA